MRDLVAEVERELLPRLQLESVHPHEPVVVRALPSPWYLVGTGNYAAVFGRPDYPDWVVKVYAPGRPGWDEEVAVYRRLGSHPAFSECLHAGERYLILRHLKGITLFDSLNRGIPIPPSVIQDIDEALEYARSRGLWPQDVHAKNVLMKDGHGLVVDVSDFGRPGADLKWIHFKKAYDRIYRPMAERGPVAVPLWVLNLIRRCYRIYNRLANR